MKGASRVFSTVYPGAGFYRLPGVEGVLVNSAHAHPRFAPGTLCERPPLSKGDWVAVMCPTHSVESLFSWDWFPRAAQVVECRDVGPELAETSYYGLEASPSDLLARVKVAPYRTLEVTASGAEEYWVLERRTARLDLISVMRDGPAAILRAVKVENPEL